MARKGPSDDDDYSKVGREQMAERIHLRLSTELWLRFHTGLIVAGTIVVGFLTSLALQRVEGLRHWLGVRYGLASLAAYAGFLLLVRWWVRYIAGVREAIGDEGSDQGRLDPAHLRTPEPRPRKDRPSDGCGDGCGDPGCLDVEGLAILMVILALAWIFSAGPLILSEIAADVLLAGGLLRWARRTEVSWIESAWRSTRLPFALTTLMMVAFGLFAQSQCDGVVRFGQVWTCLVNR